LSVFGLTRRGEKELTSGARESQEILSFSQAIRNLLMMGLSAAYEEREQEARKPK
jgi:hypothetical protein